MISCVIRKARKGNNSTFRYAKLLSALKTKILKTQIILGRRKTAHIRATNIKMQSMDSIVYLQWPSHIHDNLLHFKD